MREQLKAQKMVREQQLERPQYREALPTEEEVEGGTGSAALGTGDCLRPDSTLRAFFL